MATLILKINDTSLLNLFTALAKRLKVTAKVVKEEKSIKVVDKTPNAETLKAIKDVESGKTEKITLTEFRKQLYA